MQRLEEKKSDVIQSLSPEEFITSLEQKIKTRSSAKELHSLISNVPMWMLNIHTGDNQLTPLHQLLEWLWSNPTLKEPVLYALNLLCQLGADPGQYDYDHKSAIDYAEYTDKFFDKETAKTVKDILISAKNELSYLDGYGCVINPYSIDKRFDESDYSKNLKHAYNALRYVRSIACIGAPNNIKDSKRTDYYSESIYKKMTAELRDLNTSSAIAEFMSLAPLKINMAQLAKKYRVGCCYYQSALAYEYLWKLGVNVYNVGLTTQGGFEHHLVAISLSEQIDFSAPSTWDKNVIFCDPWTMSVYPAEYRKYQELGLFNYLKELSGVFTRKKYEECYESELRAYRRHQESKEVPSISGDLALSIKNRHHLFKRVVVQDECAGSSEPRPLGSVAGLAKF